jgi:multicomponent K+:H+ antiporter subunit G
VVHEFLLGLFVTITTPVTLILLGRAAVFRDRTEGNPLVPLREPPRDVVEPAPAED